MALPNLSAEQVQQVSGLIAEYITSQRAKYSPRAVPLSAEQSIAMGGFFSTQVLENARLDGKHHWADAALRSKTSAQILWSAVQAGDKVAVFDGEERALHITRGRPDFLGVGLTSGDESRILK